MKRPLFLRNLYSLTSLPIYVYSEEGEMIEHYDIGKREMTVFEQNLLLSVIEQLHYKPFAFLKYADELSCGMCGCKANELYYILGPFAYAPSDNIKSQHFLHKNKIQEMPDCRLEDVLKVASFILNEYESEDYTSSDLRRLLYDPTSHNDVKDQVIDEELKQADTFQKNHVYVEEEVIWNNIREGNVEWLRNNYDLLLPAHPMLLDDPKKNEEYMAVISISTAVRAAIQGGMVSRDAFLINDTYLKRIHECKTIAEMTAQIKHCYIYLAELIKNRNNNTTANMHIEACKKDIIARRFQKISLQQIADDVGISKSYMQKLFKQHEGIPITDYITRIKLESACNMLIYSDRQINEISDYLHFGSVSYFSDQFKKKIGMSPREYRLNNPQPNY